MSSKAPIPKSSLVQKIILFKLGLLNWKVPTHMTMDELLKLNTLAKSFKNGIVAVEIGSYIGASSLMIAKGLNQKSKLYCIDTWENDAMSEGNWNTLDAFKKNVESVKNKIIILKSDSVKAAENFSEKIDFIFVDGDHSYEGVKADVDSWFNKLKPGGLIIMHDIEWAEGVIKVIKEDIKPNLKKFEQLPNLFWGWKENL